MERMVLMCGVASFALLAACAGGSHSGSSATSTPSVPTSNAVEVATAPVSPGASAAIQTSFNDLNGYDGAQNIEDLASLGVLDQTGGAFNPNGLVTRAEFVRWLVKAQNALFSKEAGYQIRPARGNTSTFVDVPSSDPDFKYIQGLADAGYVIGVDSAHFAPNKPLTREQMIYVKSCVDERSNIKTDGNAINGVRGFADARQIDPKFIGAVYEGQSAGTTQTFSRVYGSAKMFRPKVPVTRGEAAIALSVMKGEWPRSAAEVLGRTPYP